MKKLILAFLFLTYLVPCVYPKNLYKGFEKGEFSIGIKGNYYETDFYLSYALNNRFEIGLGYLNRNDYRDSDGIDADINFHFFPKRRFDLYFGIGPSYCAENINLYTYDADDTLRLHPIKLKTETAEYLGGVSALCLNFYPFKNISLGLELKVRLLMGISEYGYDAICRGGLYPGIKYIF